MALLGRLTVPVPVSPSLGLSGGERCLALSLSIGRCPCGTFLDLSAEWSHHITMSHGKASPTSALPPHASMRDMGRWCHTEQGSR